MKILIVANAKSIHTARWLAQFSDQEWDIHLFNCLDDGKSHLNMKNVTIYHSFYAKERNTKHRSVKLRGFNLYSSSLATLIRLIINNFFPKYRENRLKKLIQRLQPDIIHSIEFQHSAYLTLAAKQLIKNHFPPWIVTNWGSDIFLFGKLAHHEPQIRKILREADFYSCECNRDIYLAKLYGFKGKILPVFPNTSGFNFKRISSLRQPEKVSARRLIMLKGYQSWAGRSLVGLRALERCADILTEYEVAIYLANTNDIIIASELFSDSTGVPVKIIPKNTTHNEILYLHGQARMSIGLSISDAISTSFLEAIAMGSFPIQSWTACADEWIEDGKTGILVHPEDPEIIELAIRRVLSDDDLVDQAAEINWQTCRERLDYDLLKSKAVNFYKIVAQGKKFKNDTP